MEGSIVAANKKNSKPSEESIPRTAFQVQIYYVILGAH